MNKAEEFKISMKFNIDSKPLIIDGERYYSEDVLKLYAESYKNHCVKAISDKDLELLFCKEKLEVPYCMTIYDHQTFLGFIKWFKNKLLKQ